MNIFYSKFLPEDSYLSDFQLQDSLSEAEVLVRFDLMSILVPQRRRFLLHVAHLKCIASCFFKDGALCSVCHMLLWQSIKVWPHLAFEHNTALWRHLVAQIVDEVRAWSKPRQKQDKQMK